MVRKLTIGALAGIFLLGATPSFADEALDPVTDAASKVPGDITKGLAELNPVEILTPKPIEPPAAAPAPKVKKKRVARKRTKKAKVS